VGTSSTVTTWQKAISIAEEEEKEEEEDEEVVDEEDLRGHSGARN